MGSQNHTISPDWIEAISRSPFSLVDALADDPLPRALIVALARNIRPDQIPPLHGFDPWVAALEKAKSPLIGNDGRFMEVYVFIRGMLRFPDDLANHLLKFSFERLYWATLDYALPQDAWDLLNKHLPKTYAYNGGAPCERVVEVVVSRAIHEEIGPIAFAAMTTDQELFAILSEATMLRYGGKDFLKRVSRALKNSKGLLVSEKIKILDRLLKKR